MKRLIVSSFVAIIAVSTVFAMGEYHHAPKFVPDKGIPFQELMRQAMMIMHINIDDAQEYGNPDYDYASLMIPHCQGAVDICRAVLLHSKSPKTIELANKIIARREAEIASFGAWIVAYAKPRMPLTEFDMHINELMSDMHSNIENKPRISDPDTYFASILIPHHESAIEISQALLEHGKDPLIMSLAKRLIEEESEEITIMKKMLPN